MKLYENVVIGNFLYGLGFHIARKTHSSEYFSVVNLLQQTPSDQLLGDVLLEFADSVWLIEFKNADGSLDKEKDKQKQLISALGDDLTLLDISQKVHWYIETKPFEEECVNTIKPYLNAFDNTCSRFTLETFIKHIADDRTAHHHTTLHANFKAYLQIVSMCQTDGTVGTGGLIISMKGNTLRYVQYTDIMQLKLQHREFVASIKEEMGSLMVKKRTPTHKNMPTRSL